MIGVHEITQSNDDGELVTKWAGCRTTDRHHHLHITTTQVDDGKGGTRPFHTVVDCVTAEAERHDLRATAASQAKEIMDLTTENDELKGENANLQKLLLALPQIIFHAGPAFRTLLAEELSPPDLTDDGTAVKLSGVLFTVLIVDHGRKLIVHDVSGKVEDLELPVVQGRISTGDQTTFMGHVDRIKRATIEGSDPVTGEVSLVTANTVAQPTT